MEFPASRRIGEERPLVLPLAGDDRGAVSLLLFHQPGEPTITQQYHVGLDEHEEFVVDRRHPMVEPPTVAPTLRLDLDLVDETRVKPLEHCPGSVGGAPVANDQSCGMAGTAQCT